MDPQANADAGAKLLGQLLTQYDGDTTKALWAYNAGPGNVARGYTTPAIQQYIASVQQHQSDFADVGSASSAASVPDPQPDTSGSTGDQGSPASDASFAGVPTWGWVAIGAVGLVLVMRR